MEIKSAGMFLMLSIMVLSTLGVVGKPMCDPEDNKYYHHQADTCLSCERCLKGEEVISIETWGRDTDPVKGPTECRPCRRCQPGTFSDRRSFQCQLCRNCSLYGQYETSQCTSQSDTVCDGLKSTTLRSDPTEKGNLPVSKAEDGNFFVEDTKETLYIVGIICITVFFLVILLFSKTRKLCLHKGICSREATDNQKSRKNEDVIIEIMDEDSQPLLLTQKKSSSLELQDISFSINDKCPSDPQDSNQREPAEVSNEVDIETDGAHDNFSQKVVMQRQWSYPFDEKSERLYNRDERKVTPMPAIKQKSKDDLCVASKCKQDNMALDIAQIRVVAKHLIINNLYTEVARDFELEEPDIQAVKIDYKNDPIKEISYQMLMKIKCKKERIMLDSLRNSVQNHDQSAWCNIIKALKL